MKKPSVIFIFLLIISSVFSAHKAVASVTTNDPYFKYQDYLNKIKLTTGNTWQQYTGKNVIVAVLDSGVQQNNPDLKDALWKNVDEIPNNKIDDDKNGYIDDYYGFNFVAKNSNMSVYAAHGTGVASIIAAKRNNNYGIAGIAPNAKIMALTVCSSSGCDPKDVQEAIKYATDNGADIINMSLGSDGSLGFKESYDEALAYAYNRGVLLVVSAGNEDPEGIAYGNDLNTMRQSPVCNESDINIVLGVGATGKLINKQAAWSSYGDKYVDIWAPGERIAVLSVKEFTDTDADYADGTSFSAPIISAVAALIKEQHSDWKNINIMSQILSNANTDSGQKFIDVYNTITNEGKNTTLDKIDFDGKQTINIFGQYFYTNILFSIKNSNLSGDIPKDAIQVLSINKISIDLSKLPFLKASKEPYTIKIQNVSGGYNIEKTVLIDKLPNNSSNIVTAPTPGKNSVSPSYVEEVINYYVTTEIKNIYSRIKPSTKEKSLGAITRNVLYPVIDKISNKNWIKIKFKKQEVWVPKSYVKIFSLDTDS